VGVWERGWTRRALLLGGASIGLSVQAFGTRLVREIGSGGSDDPAELERRAGAIAERHGVHIGYGAPETFFVPPYTAADASLAGWSMTAVERFYLVPALEGIEAGLAVYPPGVFSALCRAVFVCGELRVKGEPAGGTYGPAWIVIASSALGGASPGSSENALHHEFSSFIWRRDEPLRMVWETLLPADWKPSPTVQAMLDESLRGDERVGEGFVSPYGATSSENDFNTFAEAVFMDPGRLAELAARIPVIARKAALLLSVYGELDARMGGVFAKLGLDHLQNPDAWQIRIHRSADGTVEVR
jgi:hypothetical protein